MRDPKRISPLLRELKRIWKKYPDLRLGQLLLFILGRAEPPIDPFYVEDGDWLKFLKNTEQEFKARTDQAMKAKKPKPRKCDAIVIMGLLMEIRELLRDMLVELRGKDKTPSARNQKGE